MLKNSLNIKRCEHNRQTGRIGRIVSYYGSVTLILSVLSFAPLSADTVLLRSGKKFTNVKTKLSRGQISILTQNGKIYRYSIKSVKKVVPGPVRWKARPKKKVTVKKKAPEKKSKKEVKKKTVPAKKEGAVDKNGPGSENPDKVSKQAGKIVYEPSLFAGAQGLLPLWSGHYTSGRIWLGAFFSLTEAYALYRLAPYVKQPKDVIQEVQPVLLTAILPPPEGGPADLNRVNAGLLSFTYLTSEGLVLDPTSGSGFLNQRQFLNNRRQFAGLLLVALLADGISSYLLGSPVEVPTNAALEDTTSFSMGIIPDFEAGHGVQMGFSLQFRF